MTLTASTSHHHRARSRPCGGRNVFAEVPTLTATVSWESAVQRDPSWSSPGRQAGRAGEARPLAEFAQLSATKHHEFAHIRRRPDRPQRPALFVDGARELCEAIEIAPRIGAPQPLAASAAAR